MSLTLPVTLFLGPYVLFSLFFPPFAAALHACAAVGLVWIAGIFLPKRLGDLSAAATALLGACMLAYGIAMLSVFTLAASIERSHGMKASAAQWAFGALLVSLPLFVSYRLSLHKARILGPALVFAHALAVAAAVFVTELFPASVWGVGALTGALFYANRQAFIDVFHHD